MRRTLHLERAAIAAARYALRPRGIESAAEVAKQAWPDDRTTPLLLAKGAVGPVSTTGSGWADVLAPKVVGEFIGALAPQSAAARLVAASGLSLSLAGIGAMTIPGRQTRPATDVAWVGEGAPAPARSVNLSGVQIGPMRKLASFCALTREAVLRTDGERVVRTILREDVAASLDASLFSTGAATAERPAGLLNGLTPLAASSETGEAAILADLEALAIKVASAGGSGALAYIMAPQQAASAQLRLGRDRAVEIWPSLGVPAGTVIAIEPPAFVSAFGSEIEIDASMSAAMHMESTDPRQIGQSGSPATVAAPVLSAFQSDLVLLRVILDAAWTMRAPGRVAFINSVTWGASPA